MSLFQCSKCGCAEDTALCHYWSARLQGTAPICSACDPKIGKWHGEFERVPPEIRLKREMEQWLGISLDIPESHFMSEGPDLAIHAGDRERSCRSGEATSTALRMP